MSESFIARQTNHLKELAAAGKIQRKPAQQRTNAEKHELTMQSSPCRCLRCGGLVYPLMATPGPYLCELCQDELCQRDQQDCPGCHWWGGLIQTLHKRPQEKQP